MKNLICSVGLAVALSALSGLGAPAVADQNAVNIGVRPNDGTGDAARSAYIKLNGNDAELYAAIAAIKSQIASLALVLPASPNFLGTVTASSLAITGSAAIPTLNVSGTTTASKLAITGSGSTGDVSGMSVTAGGSTSTLAARFPLLAPLASPAFTGAAFFNSLGLRQTINMRSTPPDNGVFFSGNGNEISFCPWLGCDPARDINVAAGWVRSKTTRTIQNAETGLALDQYANTGFVPKWAVSTSYSTGALVLSGANGRLLYQATAGGNSAASGSGPSGTGTAISDGSVTWAYLQNANDTDAKTSLNITTAVGPNAGHTWGVATNTIQLPGFQSDLVTGVEDDFGNLNQHCDIANRNCFAHLWFTTGGFTSTAFLQASGGGDAPALASDNSTGGAMLNGINFNGANTIRNVTFGDGTNAANTLKGYTGTRHVSGFIRDESTAPASYTSAGMNSYAAWSDASTAPYGVRWEGTYGVAAAKYKDFLIGSWGQDPTYGAITVNGSLASGALAGMFGKASDPNLYLNTPGNYFFRVAGSTFVQIGAAGLSVASGVLKPPQYTVANLPTCNATTKGGHAVATDVSAAPTYRQTGLAGGGSIAVPVFCSGSAWEAH